MAFDARVAALTLLAKHAAKCLPPDGSIALFSADEAWDSTQAYSNMVAGDVATFLAGRLATAFAPIRVNAVSPSVAVSGSLSARKAEQDRGSRHNAAHGSPPGRTLTNDDIVKAVLWLMGASFVNGVTIHVDGGARFAA
jgi:NAD(P)-dependent dehydrogenase (short-subunit alcohol dehydrogenase family)